MDTTRIIKAPPPPPLEEATTRILKRDLDGIQAPHGEDDLVECRCPCGCGGWYWKVCRHG